MKSEKVGIFDPDTGWFFGRSGKFEYWCPPEALDIAISWSKNSYSEAAPVLDYVRKTHPNAKLQEIP